MAGRNSPTSSRPARTRRRCRTLLLAAAATVYANYEDAIRRQQALLENTTHLHIELPRPACVLQTTERGLLATLRFPAEPGQEEAIARRMSDAVEAALQQAPQLRRLDGADAAQAA